MSDFTTSNEQRVNFNEQQATSEKLRLGKTITWKKYNMEKVQHEKSATWKKYNMEKAQHEKSTA